jgi:hypothetical protein
MSSFRRKEAEDLAEKKEKASSLGKMSQHVLTGTRRPPFFSFRKESSCLPKTRKVIQDSKPWG